MKRGGNWRVTVLVRLAVVICVPVLVSAAATAPAQRAIDVRAAQPVTTWPDKQKRWALVIGIDKYADGQITTLGGSANDAKSIADALVKYAGFPPDQVTLMATDQPEERQPTRNNILRRLSNLGTVVPADGLLFVSFAGHGMERGNQAYLLPADAQLSNDVNLLEDTALNVTKIKERIRAIGVRQVMLVLDACRNDPGGRADQPNPLTAAFVRGFSFDVRNQEVTAFATLYATAVGQRAYEYTEKHQGYFTWELVEGLRGAAANERGEVTLNALVDYVQQRVPKRVLSDLGVGKEQKPFAEIVGYQAQGLVIAVVPHGKGTAPPTESLPAAANGAAGLPRVDPAELEMQREMMFWESIKNSTDPEEFKAYLAKYPAGQFADLARRRSQSRPAVSAGGTGTATAPMVATNAPRSLATTSVRSVWSSQIYLLGYYLGLAETAAYQSAPAMQLQQYLESAREISAQTGYAILPVEQILAATRAGATGQTQYQNLVGVRQTLWQQLDVLANCGRMLHLGQVMQLGHQQGVMEIVAFQGGDPGYLSQFAGYAIQSATAASLPTASLQYMMSMLAMGAPSRDQYQPLVNLRQQTLQSLALVCAL